MQLRTIEHTALILLLSLCSHLKSQVFYRADRISVNSSFNEIAPVLYDNGIVFSSDRKSEIVAVTFDQSGNFLYKLYFAEKKDSKNFSSPRLFATEIKSRIHQSQASFSSDGKVMYYAATLDAGGIVTDSMLDNLPKNGIFISSLGNEKWLPPAEFPFNSEEYNVGYPCISDDGTRLYFASENPSGFGGYDLYYSDFISGQWKEPVNLGSKINTSQNEVFPFLFMGNRLFFSSRGHAGEGGVDIFYSDLISGEWSSPVNMPKPFNSRYDDFALVANESMDTGYFASNRKGDDDIYMFVSTFPAFSECPPQVKEEFCYEFYESGTLSLDTTSLRYEWDLGDGSKIRGVRAVHCYTDPGFYMVQLNVIDTLTGEVSFNQASYDLLIEPLEQPYMTAPDTAYVNETVSFDPAASNIKEFTIENYYWDFGDGNFDNEQLSRHRFTEEGDFIIRLGLTGAAVNNPEEQKKACASRHIIILQPR
jgi:hypothetical protein